MKYILIVLFSFIAVITISSKSWAEEDFKGLKSIIEEANDTATLVYAMQRCSALYISFYGLSMHRKDEVDDEVMKNFLNISAKFFNFASTLVKGNNIQLSKEEQDNIIIEIRDLYDEKWKSNYVKLGRNIGTMTMEDKEICDSFLAAFNKE
jgi:hypothetical protein